MILKTFKWISIILASALVFVMVWQWPIVTTIFEQRHMFTEPHFDTEIPVLRQFNAKSPRILSFSKTNGFRHFNGIKAADRMLQELSAANGWQYFASENNNVFNENVLKQFDLVVLNNSSGTLYTPDQQASFKNFIESGGGVVALHAAGGDSSYTWRWYLDKLIRAQFLNHPMTNHIQSASVSVADTNHPIVKGLPLAWQRADEWYNFDHSPSGVTILLTIDELTYDPETSPMGEEHPLAWCHTIGLGRVFYTAMGHTPETYAEKEHQRIVAQAMRWALKEEEQPYSPN